MEADEKENDTSNMKKGGNCNRTQISTNGEVNRKWGLH